MTQQISKLTENGVRLASYDEPKVNIILDATGLKMLPRNGTSFLVDDVNMDVVQYIGFRVAMLSGLPNMTVFVG